MFFVFFFFSLPLPLFNTLSGFLLAFSRFSYARRRYSDVKSAAAIAKPPLLRHESEPDWLSGCYTVAFSLFFSLFSSFSEKITRVIALLVCVLFIELLQICDRIIGIPKLRCFPTIGSAVVVIEKEKKKERKGERELRNTFFN